MGDSTEIDAGQEVIFPRLGPCRFRHDLKPSDPQAVRWLAESTGVFFPFEVQVAVELVEERLAKGPASGYEFIFAEVQHRPVGYTCYGPIAVSIGSYDLYWIVVHKDCQGQGLGRALLARTEQSIRRAGGRRVYIETSSRPAYAGTRAFYERCAYAREAVLKDFYAPGDDKLVYVKVLK